MFSVSIILRISPNSIKRNTRAWLHQGISPRRLALTLALGFAIGCIPVIGIPTVLCAAIAIVLRLNLPAIQAANYLAMPLQLILIVPFVRMGGWLLASGKNQVPSAAAMMRSPLSELTTRMSSLAGHALFAWLIIAIPAVLLMTVTLTAMFRRVPALRTSEVGD
jgi:uncharacterized protein (DUF2062 family)